MAITDDVATLKLQVANFITSAQITALIAALGTDHTALVTLVNQVVAENAILLQEIQSMKDSIADHETRIAALE